MIKLPESVVGDAAPLPLAAPRDALLPKLLSGAVRVKDSKSLKGH